jgi:hypothetical protein
LYKPSPGLLHKASNTGCDSSTKPQGPVFPELRDLTVSICVLEMPHPWEEELLLFRNSPNLEYLAWSWDPSPLFTTAFTTGNHDTTNNVAIFISALCELLEFHWYKLHSIRLSLAKNNKNGSTLCFQDEQIARVLNSCRNPLQQFQLFDANYDRSLTWPALKRHFKTLLILRFGYDATTALNSLEIQEILSSCPGLIEFHHESMLDTRDIVNSTTYDKKISDTLLPAAATSLDPPVPLLIRLPKLITSNFRFT